MPWVATKCAGIFVLLLLEGSAFGRASADEASRIAREYLQRVWTTEHGLPDNSVRSIFQTRDGYLWIGTFDGLARFDGLKFTVFGRESCPSFDHDARMALAEDTQGNLWIGTQTGLIQLHDGEFTRFTVADGLWHDEIRVLQACRSGGLWIGTEGGLNRFNDGKITRLNVFEELPTTAKRILALFEDKDGTLWVSTRGLLQKRNPKRWEREIVFRWSEHDDFIVACIAADNAGNVWVAGRTVLRQLKDGRWISYVAPHGQDTAYITSLVCSTEGDVYCGTFPAGLLRFRQGKFDYYGAKDGLSDQRIHRVCEDRDNNIWIGTDLGGLNLLRPRRFLAYTPEDGLIGDQVQTVCATRDGSVWIGTESGLSRLSDGRFTNYTHPERRRNIIRSIVEDSNGDVWIGTLGEGVDCFRDGQFTRYTLPGEMAENKVRALLAARDGSLWIATVRGLHRLRNGQLTTLTTTNGLPVNEIRALAEGSGGEIWAGTFGGGLCQISFNNIVSALTSLDSRAEIQNPKSKIEIPFVREGWHVAVPNISDRDARSLATDGARLQITTLSATNGLSNNNVFALHEDAEGVLWTGTERGLNRLKDGRLTAFTVREGLIDDPVNTLVEDDFGNFWIGCTRGIYRVSKQELTAVAEGRTNSVRCVAYDEADGLLSRKISGQRSQPSACKAPDGRLWFPTDKGVVVIDPKAIQHTELPPPVVIEEVRANDKIIYDNTGLGDGLPERDESGRSVVSAQSPAGIAHSPLQRITNNEAGTNPKSQIANQKSKITLPPGSGRFLEFHYTAPAFGAPDKVRFKYRLEGYSSEWSDAGTRRLAYFTNLHPGHYRFQVIAATHHDLWNETGASVAFFLEPHYYETWSFYGVCALAIALSGYTLYHWRITELQKVQLLKQEHRLAQERGRIARDIHDDLGASLDQIGLLTALADRTVGPESTASSHVKEIALAVSEISQSVDEIVWATNPRNDTLRSLLAYLRKYAAEYLGDAGIRSRLEWPEQIPSVAVSAQSRHHLFLVIKEALHNVVQHAQAPEVVLRVTVEPSGLTLFLEDNGHGFDVNRARETGNGMGNMKGRIEEINGQFDLQSEPGRGTKILIQIKLD